MYEVSLDRNRTSVGWYGRGSTRKGTLWTKKNMEILINATILWAIDQEAFDLTYGYRPEMKRKENIFQFAQASRGAKREGRYLEQQKVVYWELCFSLCLNRMDDCVTEHLENGEANASANALTRQTFTKGEQETVVIMVSEEVVMVAGWWGGLPFMFYLRECSRGSGHSAASWRWPPLA